MRLVIFAVDFKKALRMRAGRADFRSGSSYNDVSAVSAFPNLDFAFCKNFGHFYVFEKCAVAFFVVFFDCGNQSEFCRQFRKTFFVGGFVHS